MWEKKFDIIGNTEAQIGKLIHFLSKLYLKISNHLHGGVMQEITQYGSRTVPCISGSLQWRQNEREASRITGVLIVCSSVFSDADQRRHQNFASLVFVRGIHRRPVDSPHNGPVTRKNDSIWRRGHDCRDVIRVRSLIHVFNSYSIRKNTCWESLTRS